MISWWLSDRGWDSALSVCNWRLQALKAVFNDVALAAKCGPMSHPRALQTTHRCNETLHILQIMHF